MLSHLRIPIRRATRARRRRVPAGRAARRDRPGGGRLPGRQRQDRLRDHPRRQPRDLLDEPRRQLAGQPHQRPGGGHRPCLVAGRHPDRLRQGQRGAPQHLRDGRGRQRADQPDARSGDDRPGERGHQPDLVAGRQPHRLRHLWRRHLGGGREQHLGQDQPHEHAGHGRCGDPAGLVARRHPDRVRPGRRHLGDERRRDQSAPADHHHRVGPGREGAGLVARRLRDRLRQGLRGLDHGRRRGQPAPGGAKRGVAGLVARWHEDHLLLERVRRPQRARHLRGEPGWQ